MSDSMICANGHEVSQGAGFCKECGVSVSPEVSYPITEYDYGLNQNTPDGWAASASEAPHLVSSEDAPVKSKVPLIGALAGLALIGGIAVAVMPRSHNVEVSPVVAATPVTVTAPVARPPQVTRSGDNNADPCEPTHVSLSEDDFEISGSLIPDDLLGDFDVYSDRQLTPECQEKRAKEQQETIDAEDHVVQDPPEVISMESSQLLQEQLEIGASHITQFTNPIVISLSTMNPDTEGYDKISEVFDELQIKYGALLIDPTIYIESNLNGEWYMAILAQDFSDKVSAHEWCKAQNLTIDDCYPVTRSIVNGAEMSVIPRQQAEGQSDIESGDTCTEADWLARSPFAHLFSHRLGGTVETGIVETTLDPAGRYERVIEVRDTNLKHRGDWHVTDNGDLQLVSDDPGVDVIMEVCRSGIVTG